MAKKEFFSSFEKNLSIDNDATTTLEKPVKTEAAAPKSITSITDITKKPKKAQAAKKSRVVKKKTELGKVATFRVNEDVLEQVKAVAYWDRKKIQDVLDEALRAYIKKVPKESLSKAMEMYGR